MVNLPFSEKNGTPPPSSAGRDAAPAADTRRGACANVAAPLILVISRDPALRLLVAGYCEPPWSVEAVDSLEAAFKVAAERSVCLIVLDDELLPADERDWFLARLNRLPLGAALFYVACAHSPLVEKTARSRGASFYTAKPLQARRLGQVLQTWLRHLRARDNRVAAP